MTFAWLKFITLLLFDNFGIQVKKNTDREHASRTNRNFYVN